jgi:long-chain acyl-CoA synthetase
MSLLAELDQIRANLGLAGQPFEQEDRLIGDVPVKVYKNIPPNLSHFIVQATRFGDRTFIVSGGRRLSYREILDQAAGLSTELRQNYGVGKGVRVAIAMRNSVEWVVAYLV